MKWAAHSEVWEPPKLTPEQERYEKRAVSNARFHCGCGWFVSSASVRRVGDALEWNCSRCGPCRG